MSNAYALTSPIGLSLFPPIELPPSDFTITGVRINAIWGDHQHVYGIDVGGIANETLQEFGGLQVAGGINYNKGTANIIGLQLAGVANITGSKLHVLGVQAALYNATDAESWIVGIQVGAVNNNPHTKVTGFELGLYNNALEVTGFQIGLINRVDNLHGLQIGLLNFNARGLFAVAPILNIGF
jgi:hypothetical protein